MAKKKQGFIKQYFMMPTKHIKAALGFIPEIVPFAKKQKIELDSWSERARKRLSNPALSNYNLGVEFYNDNRVSDAIMRFKLSTLMNSRNGEAFLWLGKSYLLKNEIDKAIIAFETANKLKAKNKEQEYFYNLYVKNNYKIYADEAITKNFFAKFASVINEYFIENYAYNGAKNIADLFFDEIKQDKALILDLGCGSGCLANILKHKNKNLTIEGLDYAREAIEICKNIKISEQKLSTNDESQETIDLNSANKVEKESYIYDKLHKVSLEKLDLDKKVKYEAIIARGIFNYVADFDAAIKNLVNYSKKGTYLMFNLNESSDNEQIEINMKNFSYPYYLNQKFPTMKNVKDICKKYSFEFIKEDKFSLDNQGNKAISLIFKLK